MDRGVQWATVHGVAMSDMTERLTLSTALSIYLCIKQIINKDLLYGTENSTRYMGKESEKEWRYIYMYITESLCYTPETNTAL